MQYPRMGQTRQYRVTVPELNGGVNYAVPPHLIGDNQLSDVSNMWYVGGALRTRPGLRGVDYSKRFADVQYRYGSVGKNGYIVRESVTKGSNYVTLIRENGTMQTGIYNIPVSSDEDANVMWASVNGQVKGLSSEDALAYISGSACGVYGLTEERQLKKLEPYRPTVLINGRGQTLPIRTVVGNPLEPFNMLSDEYYASFSAGGGGLYYFLPTAGDEVLEVKYTSSVHGSYVSVSHELEWDETNQLYVDKSSGNVQGCGVAYNKSNGCFHFYEFPTMTGDQPNPTIPVALKEGVDNNIVVRVKRSTGSFEEDRDVILGMKFSTWYGGGSSGLTGGTRLFVGGNPKHPNLVHWSSLDNPLYFPEGNCAYVGEDTDPVTAFGKQNDMLVIFKESALFYTTYVQGNAVTAEDIEAQRVTDIEAAAAMFPMMQIHPDVGCDCPNTIQLCNNRLVWLNSDGNVYGLFSSGVYNERNLRRLSLQLGDRLREESKETLKAASATRHKEHYLLLVGKRTVYAMDFSSYGFNYYGSYSTDEKAQQAVAWYRWELPWDMEALIRVRETAVAIGDGFRTFLFDDTTDADSFADDVAADSAAIRCRFRTKLFDFGYSERFKRVDSLYLQLIGRSGKNAFLTCYSGQKAHGSADIITFLENGATAPRLVRPNAIRTRLFGFEVESECCIEVGDLIMNYSTMGAIR